MKVVRASRNYRANVKNGLTIRRGQKVYVVARNGGGWYTGMVNGRWGVFKYSGIRGKGHGGGSSGSRKLCFV